MKGPDPNPSAPGAPFRLIQPAQGFTSWSLSSEYTMYKDPGYRVSAEPFTDALLLSHSIQQR